MESPSRSLEIKVISGECLRVNRRQVKSNAFVTVRVDSVTAQTTRVDKEGGSHPAWNEKFVVDMPMHVRFLTLEVQCKTYSGNKVVGTARIPVSDFAGGGLPENYLHLLSYRLRDAKGERNGIINFSVKLASQSTHYTPNYSMVNAAAENSGHGHNYWQPWPGTPAGGKVTGGVVTGVPVWYGYQV